MECIKLETSKITPVGCYFSRLKLYRTHSALRDVSYKIEIIYFIYRICKKKNVRTP